MAKKKTPWEKLGVSQHMYETHLQKYDSKHPDNIKKVRKEKKAQRIRWWKDNWIALLSLVTSIIAIGLTILFELY